LAVLQHGMAEEGVEGVVGEAEGLCDVEEQVYIRVLAGEIAADIAAAIALQEAAPGEVARPYNQGAARDVAGDERPGIGVDAGVLQRDGPVHICADGAAVEPLPGPCQRIAHAGLVTPSFAGSGPSVRRSS